MNPARALFALALAVILTACVSLEAAKSFKDRLAYGYETVAATRNTAAALLDRKRISKDDATQVQVVADQARGCLDLASGKTDPEAALLCQAVAATQVTFDIGAPDGQLLLALDVLTKLEAYLATKGTP